MWRYVDFVNEQFELVVESNIIYSDKFKKVLSKMDYHLAKTLLDIENKDYPISSNYFDISDKTDAITFISDKKAKEIADKHQGKYRYSTAGRFLSDEHRFQYLWDALEVERKEVTEPPVGSLGSIGKRTISPKTGKEFVVFIPEDTQYTPIPVNIQALKEAILNSSDSIFWNNGRQVIRVGRGVKAILNSAGVNTTDKEIEDFVNKYKATVDSMNNIFFNFELVKGDDIAHWYNREQYYLGEDGSLGSSCMCTVQSDFFDIYCQNPEKISLVIYKAPDNPYKIKGRALLWLLNDGKLFMDRIYTHHDSDIELFRQYARVSGYWCKYHNSSTSESTAYNPVTYSTETLSLNVNLLASDYDKFPYLDTLKYYNINTGLISNTERSGMLLLEDTDGGYSNSNSCSTCDDEGSYDCRDCDGSGSESCDVCDGDKTTSCISCDEGISDCPACDGVGKLGGEDCLNCEGSGKATCNECDGSGTETCSSCEGSGRDTCSSCDGEGTIDCDNC